MNEHPKHETLRSLGVFFGGLGILLAGIALLLLALRWPLRPPNAGGRQAISQPASIESLMRQAEDDSRLAGDPRMKAAAAKLQPTKVEVKTERKPVP